MNTNRILGNEELLLERLALSPIGMDCHVILMIHVMKAINLQCNEVFYTTGPHVY